MKILLIRLLVIWTLKESLFDDPCIPNVDDGSVVYVAAGGAGAGVIVVVVVDEPLGLFVVVMVVGVFDVMMILVDGPAEDAVLIYGALLFCGCCCCCCSGRGCGCCCWVYALYILVGC